MIVGRAHIKGESEVGMNIESWLLKRRHFQDSIKGKKLLKQHMETRREDGVY